MTACLTFCLPVCFLLPCGAADRLLGVYLVSERQHRRRQLDVLTALQNAGVWRRWWAGGDGGQEVAHSAGRPL